MTKQHLFLSALLVLAFSANAKERTKPEKFSGTHNLHLELGGHGGLYSLNYEAIPLNKKRIKIAVQVGAAYYPLSKEVRDCYFPVLLMGIYSFNKHHIEIGVGHVVAYMGSRTSKNNIRHLPFEDLLTTKIGYRYQKPDGKIIIRAGLTPSTPPFELLRLSKSDIYILPALSVGWAF